MFEKIRNYAKNRAFSFVCPESRSDYDNKQITRQSFCPSEFQRQKIKTIFLIKWFINIAEACGQKFRRVNNRAYGKPRGNTAPFTVRLFIGFLPIFGLTLPNFATQNLGGQGELMVLQLSPTFSLEEKSSFEIENDAAPSMLAITQDSALIVSGASAPISQPKKIKVVMTAYSSHPNETDDTPFITASGTKTRDGVVAANFLPFGTAVKIPKLFGDKVFVVEDRMHRRFSKRMDIWMPSKKDALIFGKVSAEIEILN